MGESGLRKIRVLDLFAGSRSISKAAIRLEMETYSSDIEPFEGIDYVCDIRDFDISRIPWKPDVIWASPPCQAFTVAQIGKNWNRDHTPKTDKAREGMELVLATQKIIRDLEPKYFFLENPRGKLRKLPMMQNFGTRHTVTYCQYGDNRMKPTDIWTNNPHWKPRPMCSRGDNCHEAAPRGSKTGTQGLKGNYERSKIPNELCTEILIACKNYYYSTI